MSDAPGHPDERLERLLGSERPGGRFARYSRWLLAAAALVVLVGGGYALWRSGSGTSAPRYQTEAIIRGTLVVTVSATGNLQPTNQVDVGSELSGTIETVLVDVNDRVRKGQVLARLNISKLQDQIAKSRAVLASAEAKVLQVGATVKETRANLERFREVARLSGGKVPSKAEMDTAEATLERALADEAGARAAVAEARATLSADETNLAKASIRSPIDGVVLAREVEPGQTVAATLQAPVLFTLAENLSQMELQVDVDEADVGQVREGQRATFTVDAYPGRQYPARIRRVDFGSQTKEGVVSYRTVLTVANDDLSLRPGMTGTAEITTATRENVLLVPNAALRFTPSANGEADATPGRGLLDRLLPRPPRRTVSKPARPPSVTGAQQVWVLRDGQPVPLSVTVGVTDGRLTEVTGGELEEGMSVITEAVGASP